ncbi:MAG: hypothetical protein JWR65_47 [Massilia sp.]|nr:hypothetical protein [Massilia sp.]
MNMLYSHPRCRAFGAALLAALLTGCVAVKPQQLDAAAPPSHSVPEADARLAKAAADRARAEAAFAVDEQQCYTKFLVNNCLDKARETRRAALSGLRAIEIEAERFIRQAKVDERDRELARAEAQFQAEQARMAASPQPARPAEPATPAAPKRGVANQKAAAQAAKLNSLEAADKAGAAKRAANVQAFEKRKRDSEQRQKEIAEKKKKAVNEGEGE